MINEKGKLFGLINIIDLAILLVLVAALAIGYTRLNNDGTKQEGPVTEKEAIAVIYYEPETDTELEALKAGDQLIADNRLQPVFIEDVKVMPKKVTVEKNDKLIEQEHPFKKEVLVTIKGTGEFGQLDITLANQIVKVGRSFILKTYTAELEGTVSEVRQLEK